MREEKKDGKKWEENELTGRQKEKDTKIIDYRPILFQVRGQVIHTLYI